MATMPFHRYASHPVNVLPDRTWPSKEITKAPIWCSVCLRDGNQALIDPMDGATKLRMFRLLVKLDFKEIEVGFPSASQTDYDFVRLLIEERHIPEDVTIQVLTQSRPELIARTFESVKGARKVIVHLYNPTSELQRRVVFQMDRTQTIELALSGARQIKKLAAERPETEWVFQYSPESFTGTERDFAVDICDAVMNEWEATPQRKVIINLPATVELFKPNVYADYIEWMCKNLHRRDSAIISLHTHNDRGSGVAATELGLLAGADRVEGTLLGNGERTGNLDIVIVALNLMHQGVDPELDLSDATEIVRVVEDCTHIRVHERHPYLGLLAFTAFSGGHQDAIRKGMAAQRRANSPMFASPYLHVDPRDIGRDYKDLIRVNSQSGKGGIGYIMENEFGYEIPRDLLIDFSYEVQTVTDQTKKEIRPHDLLKCFEEVYLAHTTYPLELNEYVDAPGPTKGTRSIKASVTVIGASKDIQGIGNGPVNAFANALCSAYGLDLVVADMHSHAITAGSDAAAVVYVPIHIPGREPVWGVGRHTDSMRAQLLAVIGAVNRAGLLQKHVQSGDHGNKGFDGNL